MILPLLLALAGCEPPTATPPDWPAITPASPQAGAAEGTLDLPVGTPMGGYSARCACLSGVSKQDSRDSAYSTSFVESTGVHMRPGIKVVWLESGGEHLVIAKVDVIYSFDGLVTEITRQLEEQTGLDLKGRVVLSASHSHASYGPFSDSIHFYLGGDLFNEEIFQRFAAEVTEVAMEAYGDLQPAAIGTGWAKDWDPNDEIYRDRRGVNDELQVWPDGDQATGKDPYLNVLRIDDLDDEPIAVVFTFGVHGVILSENKSMISPDSSGGLEAGVEAAFDHPVVAMHLQGPAGDISPAGRGGNDFARVESMGELARDRVMALWEATPTSDEPLHLETASRAIWEHPSQIHVTRDGTVDWKYRPYEEGYNPDNIIYNEDGSIASPIDEFNTQYGAAFCGDGSFQIPVGGLDVEVPPYDECMSVDLVTNLIYAFFELPPGSIPLPLPSSFKAGTTMTRVGPLPTLDPDGTESERDLLVGFFPGEPLTMYAEQWRRRTAAELGLPMPLMVGYAQDHEGYLLIPEDWLMGGYEPNIAIWGPLQGEHIMERSLEYADELLSTTDVREDPDPYGWYAPVEYPERALPEVRPDETPDAGTRLDGDPGHYVWLPDGFTLDLDTPAQVERGAGMVQLAWQGGDPAVDLPRVVLERQDGEDWVEVLDGSGRPVTDASYDMLMSWTPIPLYPASGDQHHTWWVVWQAAAHDGARLGLPEGTYRLHASGKRYKGQATTWPWDTTEYEVAGEPFEVVPATLSVEPTDGGVFAWFDGPPLGFRLLDVDGIAYGKNPLRGTLTVEVQTASGTTSHEVAPAWVAGGKSFYTVDIGGALSITVTDAWGNTGSVSF